MTVFFIGAGPGAPDLLTLRAKSLIERCPVILYAGSLVPQEILQFADGSADLTNTALLSLGEIITAFQEAAMKGKDVARLHSGDPSLYSAIAEQIHHLKKLDIAYEIVPGVPAFAAAAAAMGQELTLPDVCQTVILTRSSKRASSVPDSEQLKNLGASKATLAIHLSVKNADQVADQLIPHYGKECPVVIAVEISWPGEKIIKTTLEHLTSDITTHNIERTAIIFVGQALDQNLKRESALYDKTYARHLKPAKE